MNSADHPRTGPSEDAQTLRSLPGLDDTDLPFPGHHRLREHLMREAAADGASPARARPRRALVLALSAAAAVAATAVAVGLGAGGPGGHPSAAPPQPDAVRLLDRVALAAQREPAPAVRDDQFLYTRTTGHSTTLTETPGGGMEASPSDASAERWVSVDGSAGTLARTASGDWTAPVNGKAEPTLNGPTYRFLESLPTDPARLLEVIYADTRPNHGAGTGSTTGPDQGAFVTIGDLLRSMEAPPGVSAALYRAAARIPGVVLVPEATDAAGRTGVAVARVHKGERTEWIFDRDSLRLLGERTVTLRDSAWGKAGTAVTSVAITGRGVTDRAGQPPKG
ncbi:CU044_5270 family protein [Streptomyces sp. NBC_00249]|uniref:CU044_5270 family protein n=1 Tax=Streptomyces sp. NBC_00249 TaxID=2975690 RepID=UPI00224D612C|nr:CU044_5270 family protein [Streptomyces sp. NBC_00249]MCX5192492.1 CU044_5270 family protein [Streptomyces sp. NBC_00249]